MQGAAARSKGGTAAERARLPLQLVCVARAGGACCARPGAGVERGRHRDAAPLDARLPPCPHLPRDAGERRGARPLAGPQGMHHLLCSIRHSHVFNVCMSGLARGMAV